MRESVGANGWRGEARSFGRRVKTPRQIFSLSSINLFRTRPLVCGKWLWVDSYTTSSEIWDFFIPLPVTVTLIHLSITTFSFLPTPLPPQCKLHWVSRLAHKLVTMIGSSKKREWPHTYLLIGLESFSQLNITGGGKKSRSRLLSCRQPGPLNRSVNLWIKHVQLVRNTMTHAYALITTILEF